MMYIFKTFGQFMFVIISIILRVNGFSAAMGTTLFKAKERRSDVSFK